MVLFRAIAIALVACIIILFLRSERPEISFAISIAASMILLFLIAEKALEVISVFSEIVKESGMKESVYLSLLKMVGIAYVTEIAADTVEDFGSKSLAAKITFIGKITVFLLALPIFSNLLGVVVKLI